MSDLFYLFIGLLITPLAFVGFYSFKLKNHENGMFFLLFCLLELAFIFFVSSIVLLYQHVNTSAHVAKSLYGISMTIYYFVFAYFGLMYWHARQQHNLWTHKYLYVLAALAINLFANWIIMGINLTNLAYSYYPGNVLGIIAFAIIALLYQVVGMFMMSLIVANFITPKLLLQYQTFKKRSSSWCDKYLVNKCKHYYHQFKLVVRR